MCAAGCERHRAGSTPASPWQWCMPDQGDAGVAPTRGLVMGRAGRVMRPIKYLIGAGVMGAVLGLTACSPEDGRKIGERGADVGNRPERSADVELHGKSDPAHDVPNKVPAAARTGENR